MRVVHSLGEVGYDVNSVVTVGTFDGVHLAHREIIREVVNRARMREGRSVAVTFDPHPRDVVASGRGPARLLSTLEERVASFQELQLDVLVVIRFNYEFSRLTPKAFYAEYVVHGIGASEVVVGYDHMFGRDREAGIQELLQMGKEFGFSVFAVHPFMIQGEVVSSSLIREALQAGEVERARRFLGYPYGMNASVVRGDARGKTLGFPTANLAPNSARKLIPRNGVYLVAVGYNGRRYYGMANIGIRPTVSSSGDQNIEVHIFEFEKDIYGEDLELAFLGRLRDEQKFSSVQELVTQLEQDKKASLRMISEVVGQV